MAPTKSNDILTIAELKEAAAAKMDPTTRGMISKHNPGGNEVLTSDLGYFNGGAMDMLT